jgi:putative flippase GtrA
LTSRSLTGLHRDAVPAQLTRFCVVGASNTAVALLAFWLLERAGVPYPVAAGLSFGAGAVNGYLLNRAWTFRVPGSFARYIAIQAVGVGLDVGLVAAGVGALHLEHLLAQLVAIPLVTTTNFTLSRRFAFAFNHAATRFP